MQRLQNDDALITLDDRRASHRRIQILPRKAVCRLNEARAEAGDKR